MVIMVVLNTSWKCKNTVAYFVGSNKFSTFVGVLCIHSDAK